MPEYGSLSHIFTLSYRDLMASCGEIKAMYLIMALSVKKKITALLSSTPFFFLFFLRQSSSSLHHRLDRKWNNNLAERGEVHKQPLHKKFDRASSL